MSHLESVPVIIRTPKMDGEDYGWQQRRRSIQWVDIEHPENPGEIYRFDVSFMLSTFDCIFGRGCLGAVGAPDTGCCALGAYFDGEEDLQRTALAVSELDDDLWQRHKTGRGKEGWVSVVGNDRKTRQHRGACIFLNREGHKYPGCAFYWQALRNGLDSEDLKPKVCSLYPVKVEEDDNYDGGAVVHIVAPVDAFDWNPGFSWWCPEDTAAYRTEVTEPFYIRWKKSLLMGLPEVMWDEFHKWVLLEFGDRSSSTTEPEKATILDLPEDDLQ